MAVALEDGGQGWGMIPHKIGESKSLIEACKQRDDLLDMYISADDPALIEVLTEKIQELQEYIDNTRKR